ncbi:MAG: squalene/phytoene synthase family protein [Phycisphaerales bacterium]|nr:squalene/phytoene synthase family protein [Phycisphaerales bacterium]
MTDSDSQPLQVPTSAASSSQENFSVLSPLVPSDLRPHFKAVYDYCRLIDDLADDPGIVRNRVEDSATRLGLLALARNELRAAADGSATNPVFVALGQTIREKGLPLEPFEDLISAFEQDQRVSRYETWDQLIDYCTRSANPVGRIILMLDAPAPAAVDAANLRLSDTICTALQLINFWQDVRRDLIERDRIYLPSAEFVAGSHEPLDATLRDWISRPDDPVARLAYIRALRPLVERTAAMFAEGAALPGRLGARLGPVVWLFWKGGMETLRLVERTGCTTLWERPRLSGTTKASFVVQAIAMKWLGRWKRSR